MLTKPLLEGDRVLLVETRSHRSPNPQIVNVDKVTKKFIYTCGKKFDLEGRHISDFPCYTLRESLEEYEEVEKRDRLISKIKLITQSHGFGEKLTTEHLEAIIFKLTEAQNAK